MRKGIGWWMDDQYEYFETQKIYCFAFTTTMKTCCQSMQPLHLLLGHSWTLVGSRPSWLPPTPLWGLYSALVFSSYVFFLIFKYSRVSWTILDFFLAAICWIFPYFTSCIAQIHSNSSSGWADQVLGMDGLGPAGVRAVVVSCRALCSLVQTCFSSSCIAKRLTLSGDKSYSDIQTNAVSANAPTHIQTYE